MTKTEKLLEEHFRPIAQRFSLELVDVVMQKEGGKIFLRVYLDSHEGMSVEKCEQFHRAALKISLLETLQYDYFEVSSRGDRALKTERDYAWFLGKPVEVRLYKAVEGRKKATGILVSFDKNALTLNTPEGLATFAQQHIASVRPYFE